MRHLVVDASVAIKWFVPEIHSLAAVHLLDSETSFSAPDLILAEIGNTLWKKTRSGEITPDEASEILESVEATGIEIIPSAAFLSSALDLAIALDRTVYDCLYLSVAIAQGCAVVTADSRFHSAVSASTLAAHILWIENAV